MASFPSKIADVTTPCLLVDVDKVKNNADRMQETCRKMKVQLRSHVKTHRTVRIITAKGQHGVYVVWTSSHIQLLPLEPMPLAMRTVIEQAASVSETIEAIKLVDTEAADILTAGKRSKIVCATLSECELYADNGFDDILLAFPITADKIPRCAALTNKLDEFHVLLSSLDCVQCLKDGASGLNAGKVWSVFLEIDCGYERTGISWDSDDTLEAGSLVHEDPNMKLQGLYTHCGQSYDITNPKEQKNYQKKIVNNLLSIAKKLRSSGIEVPVVGTGSTPTCSLADSVLASLDEFHPGNYVFYDYEHVLLGACQLEDVACCVATRVVNQRPELNMLVVDCGFMALGHDGMAQRPDDFCVIKDNPHLKMIGMSQELGKIKAKDGEKIDFARYPVGTMLFIYPFHSCATAAMHNEYIVHSGQKITGTWKPVKGW